MDAIQKELIKAGRKDLAQEYYTKISSQKKKAEAPIKLFELLEAKGLNAAINDTSVYLRKDNKQGNIRVFIISNVNKQDKLNIEDAFKIFFKKDEITIGIYNENTFIVVVSEKGFDWKPLIDKANLRRKELEKAFKV
jgi:hypothetical protein